MPLSNGNSNMMRPSRSRLSRYSLPTARRFSTATLLLYLFLLSQCHDYIQANIPSSIPRSTPSSDISSLLEKDSDGITKCKRLRNLVLWNPSSKIDSQGFIRGTFSRTPGDWEWSTQLPGKYGPRSKYFHKLLASQTTIRQVPGDGNCLFHSITVALCAVANHTHVDMNLKSSVYEQTNIKDCDIWDHDPGVQEDKQDDTKFDLLHLYRYSRYLRHQAVHALSSKSHRLLFLQGDEYLRACDLIEAAASQYDITGEEYCSLMKKDSYWGGGPEIVALCNVLRRPIHVYELCSAAPSSGEENAINDETCNDGKDDIQEFRLRRMACFGSPKFDKREPLHILSADSRFPDIEPGKQSASGNHFLVMLPEEQMTAIAKKQIQRKFRPVKRKDNRVRGGARDREFKHMSRKYPPDDVKQGSERKKTLLSRVLSLWKNIYANLC